MRSINMFSVIDSIRDFNSLIGSTVQSPQLSARDKVVNENHAI